MNVVHVSIRPTEAADQAGRPALTPELLAASGARYSRSNEGLDAILARIDPANLDRSVDSIFKMIDYGHQSIADMAPVAMFLDGVSIWLAYLLWSLCPTAGGQESSTRYIRLAEDGLIAPGAAGLPDEDHADWTTAMQASFAAYRDALAIWEQVFDADPTVARIPTALLEDPSDKAKRQVARMRRNYAFDRARYYLPVAALTNVMMVMSARAWVALCQALLSYPVAEAVACGEAIRAELALAAPRLLKHAVRKDSFAAGLRREFDMLRIEADRAGAPGWADRGDPAARAIARLEVFPPAGFTAAAATEDLAAHDNRYAWIGAGLRRTAVRFGWSAVAMAEVRDLNRHRTGTKHCPLIPLGFYSAADAIPSGAPDTVRAALACLVECGRSLSATGLRRLRDGRPDYIYWTLLGTQYAFEHTTTADKFLYEAELRTGVGAHYRYARHLHDALSLWYDRYPDTRGLVLEGSAEPE